MKSLVLFSYRQPVEGSKFRWGVLQGRRDLKKNPLSSETVNGGYRKWDSQFKRSRLVFLAFFKFFAYLPKSLVSKELGRRDRAANLVPSRLKYFVFSYQIRLVFLMFVLAIGR